MHNQLPNLPLSPQPGHQGGTGEIFHRSGANSLPSTSAQLWWSLPHCDAHPPCQGCSLHPLSTGALQNPGMSLPAAPGMQPVLQLVARMAAVGAGRAKAGTGTGLWALPAAAAQGLGPADSPSDQTASGLAEEISHVLIKAMC